MQKIFLNGRDFLSLHRIFISKFFSDICVNVDFTEGDVIVNVKLANPFIEAFMKVMPLLGCPNPKRIKVYLQDDNVVSAGVSVRVSFTKGLMGSVVYNMHEDTAKFIASTMMMGMPVAGFDDLAKSAISELSNMLTANATTNLTSVGFLADIAPPQLVVGTGTPLPMGLPQSLGVAMDVGGHVVDILIGIKKV